MTMEFLELSTVAGDGVGFSVSRMRTVGFGFAIAAGSGYGSSELAYWTHGLLVGGGEVAPPAIPALGHSEMFQRTEGAGYSRIVGEGGGSVSSMGTTRGQQGAMGASYTPIQTAGYVTPNLSAYGFLVNRAPIISSFGDQWFQALAEVVSLAGLPRRQPIAVLREIVMTQAAIRCHYEGTQRASDVAAFGARVSWVLRQLIEDGFAVGGTGTADFTQLVRIVGRLLASGRATHVAEAVVQLVDALVLLSAQDALSRVTASDTVKIRSVVSSLYRAVASAVDRVLLQATGTGTQQIVVVVRDTVAMRADLSSEAELVMLLRESVGFAASLSLDTGEYIAWVLNTESKGLSRYTNYPFNSLTRFGKRYYGAASDGIHRLEGDKDNGEDIHAFIRGGLSDYGTRLRKRIPECFIGYSSNGTLVLRVIIVDEEGNKAAAHYRLPVRGAANKQANRFKLGRGLESVDWAFELHNVDGSDFDVSSIEFRPVNLTRRTRG
jgi:hypothetical protein